MFAHYDKETKKKQLLQDHLLTVAASGKISAQPINQGNVLLLIGLYHDLGKSERRFQMMMLNGTNERVNHSSAGAKYLSKEISDVLNNQYVDKENLIKYGRAFIETICYVISAHHGVYDIPFADEDSKKFGNSRLLRRLAYDLDDSYHYDEDIIPFANDLKEKLPSVYQKSLSEIILVAFQEYVELFNKLKWTETSEMKFYEALVIRLYLSLLKNADILDTVNAYDTVVNPISEVDRQNLSKGYYQSIEKLYKSYNKPTTKINESRTKIAKAIKNRGEHDHPGIYRLDLPTGSGKTNLSMRYGFHQMYYKRKKKFIYITPFLSVLEQNAYHIRKVVGEKNIGVLEHHSNILTMDSSESDAKQQVMREYLVDTWDSPIVLSTMVQLFQTFFKNKSSNIRRFSNLIDSVLILDEVQSLPVDVTTLFNLTINFLSIAMNASIVLCTATQPVYDSKYIKHKIRYGGNNNEEIDLLSLTNEDREVFDRTEIYKFSEDNNIATLEQIAERVEQYENDSILIILNTKAAVKKLYELLSKRTIRQCYHLSTNMCAMHRLDIIKKIKENITEPLICVSTQLIEAGVDLDFNRVIRSYAGIDSIVQAAGRCNREGKLVKGIVELVDVTEEQEDLSSTALKPIRDKKITTKRITANKKSPINIEEFNNEFFERYYANTEEKVFDYITSKDESTIYEMLSTNKNNGSTVRSYLKQAFDTAGKKMDLIKDDAKGVIVYYDNGEFSNKNDIEKLIVKIRKFESGYKVEDLEDVKKLLRELQPYTVNIREGSRWEKSIMQFQNGYIQILQEHYYSQEIGIIEEDVPLFY